MPAPTAIRRMLPLLIVLAGASTKLGPPTLLAGQLAAGRGPPGPSSSTAAVGLAGARRSPGPAGVPGRGRGTGPAAGGRDALAPNLMLRLRGGFKAKWGEKHMPGLGKKRVSECEAERPHCTRCKRQAPSAVCVRQSCAVRLSLVRAISLSPTRALAPLRARAFDRCRKGPQKRRKGTKRRTGSFNCWSTSRSSSHELTCKPCISTYPCLQALLSLAVFCSRRRVASDSALRRIFERSGRPKSKKCISL